MDPATLIAVAKDTKRISDFVFGNGLKASISDLMGDIHADAALLALETARDAKNKRERINSVITHLEAAHAAYVKSLLLNSAVRPGVKHSLFGFLKASMKIGYNYLDLHETYNKDNLACCLIDMCYVALGEREATLKSLELPDNTYLFEYKIPYDDTSGRSNLRVATGEWIGSLCGFPKEFVLFYTRGPDILSKLYDRDRFLTELKVSLKETITNSTGFHT